MNGRIADTGEIVEVERHKRRVIKWRNKFRADIKAEGYSQCTMQLETIDGAVKLAITHEMEQPGSKFIEAVSNGWPRILSNLKSLMENRRSGLALISY